MGYRSIYEIWICEYWSKLYVIPIPPPPGPRLRHLLSLSLVKDFISLHSLSFTANDVNLDQIDLHVSGDVISWIDDSWLLIFSKFRLAIYAVSTYHVNYDSLSNLISTLYSTSWQKVPHSINWVLYLIFYTFGFHRQRRIYRGCAEAAQWLVRKKSQLFLDRYICFFFYFRSLT